MEVAPKGPVRNETVEEGRRHSSWDDKTKLLRRPPGEVASMILSTLALYLVARIEVTCARLTGRLSSTNSASPDRLPASQIPSVYLGETADRILGEIDQYGFVFARDPRDVPILNKRTEMTRRWHQPLLVALSDGEVYVRKGPTNKRAGGMRQRCRHAIGWEFYLETAALLRLQGLPFIPGLRKVDLRERTILMDFIRGETLYKQLGGAVLTCGEIQRAFIGILQDSGCAVTFEIGRMLRAMAERGVVPLDIHTANFIRGGSTQRLYMVDFHLCYLWPTPGWQKVLRRVNSSNCS
jgi:hypothetical protein